MLSILHGFSFIGYVAFIWYSFWRAMDVRLMRAKNMFQFNDELVADYQQTTVAVANLSLVFFALCLALFVYTILREKGARRAFSIVAVVFSAGMLIWSLLMKESPSHISFDEVYPVWILVPVFYTACSMMIVYRRKSPASNDEILDHNFR